MGRLTKINEDACQFCRTWAICSEEESCFLYKVYEKLSDYEDMEEQGRLIELPCKPSELVWEAHEYYPTRKTMYCCNAHIVESVESGYGIGYTKEEAEAKLKELEGEGAGHEE